MRPIVELLGESWAARLPKAQQILEPIHERLVEEIANKITIYPKPSQVFRVFQEMPFEQVKVVILGQDPYHSPEGMATGRAFECGKHPSPSWRKISEVYKEQVPDFDHNVSYGKLQKWASQGVFLINKALTVREKLPATHTKLWEPFTEYVMSTLLTDLNGRAFVLLGGEARKVVPHVHPPHKGFYYEHPAFAAYEKRKWNAPGIFEEINKFVNFTHGTKISW